jgi:quinol monooxygenase YgiN
MSWDNAKDETRYRKYALVSSEMMDWSTKKQGEGWFKSLGITDNTGHIISVYEFEDMDALSKTWTNPEYRAMMMKLNPLIDNCKIRLCRPVVRISED